MFRILSLLASVSSESYCEQQRPTDTESLDTFGKKGTFDTNFSQVTLSSASGYYDSDVCAWGSAVMGATGFHWIAVSDSKANAVSTSAEVPDGMLCLVSMSRSYTGSNSVCASHNQALCFPKRMQTQSDTPNNITGRFTSGSDSQESVTNVVYEQVDAARQSEYRWFGVVDLERSTFHGCEPNSECTFTMRLFPSVSTGPSDCKTGGSCNNEPEYIPDSNAKVTDTLLPNLRAAESNDYSDVRIQQMGASDGDQVVCDRARVTVTLKTGASAASNFEFKFSFDGIYFDDASAPTRQDYTVTVPIKNTLLI